MSAVFFCLLTGYLPRAETRILGWDGDLRLDIPLKMLLNVLLVLLCDVSGLTSYP